MKINIAVFASGSGTNAENLIRYFKTSTVATVKLVVCNKPEAYVLKRAENMGVESILVTRKEWQKPENLIRELRKRKIDMVVLAGFLWLVPEELVNVYPGRIINIHPALLPAFGGKGMYGDRVHEAVRKSREAYTGITIHFVDRHYDNGQVIFQEKVAINPYILSATAIAKKVHELEYKWFPRIVEEVAAKISEE